MPKRHHYLYKASVLQCLLQNVGDVEVTAQITGMTRSLLYEWKNELQANGASVILQPHYHDLRGTMVAQNYQRIRNDLFSLIYQTIDEHNSTEATDERAKLILALSRLIDRLEKLQHTINTYTDFALTIDFLHPDGEKRAYPFKMEDYNITKKAPPP